jgi:hypothetical protein
MWDDAGEKKICKGSFRSDVVEVCLVPSVALNSQAGCKDEETDAGNETREEGIEGVKFRPGSSKGTAG